MSFLSTLAAETAAIVAQARGDFANMSAQNLNTVADAMLCTIIASGSALSRRCGDAERAKLEIRRATQLPPSVLIRRATEAEQVIKLDGVPSLPQHAAMIARLIATVETIDAELERREGE